VTRDPVANRIRVYAEQVLRTESEIFDAASKMLVSEEYQTEDELEGLLKRRRLLRMQLADLRDIEREMQAQESDAAESYHLRLRQGI
jgi:hypothetical protein